MGRYANSDHRPVVLKSGPLHYAPENEQGVVFLFSHLAKKLHLRVDRIQQRFPDCHAYRKTGRGERLVRIEFEFRSRDFKQHRHPFTGVDWIVCWEHNWPRVPPKLHVVELRKFFNLGFNIWNQPISPPDDELARAKSGQFWSVSRRASKGDLILWYVTSPEKCVRHIHELLGGVEYADADPKWKTGKDYFAPMRRVCTLKSPIFLEDLSEHKILRTASFVRAMMRGRPNATEDWAYLYEMITRRNPALRSTLSKFSPDRLLT